MSLGLDPRRFQERTIAYDDHRSIDCGAGVRIGGGGAGARCARALRDRGRRRRTPAGACRWSSCETVNDMRLVTDSNGLAAFDEPGLMGQDVFFHVKSHGYEFPKDGFGYRGKALKVEPGGHGTAEDQADQHRRAALPGHRRRDLSRHGLLGGDGPDPRAAAQRPGLRLRQRDQRRLPRQDPLVLGRHEQAGLSAGQLPRPRRDLAPAVRRRARPGARGRPRVLRRREDGLRPARRRRCPARARPGSAA